MAKASVARTSFNAGEFSPLVEGRVDLDRYPASLRKSVNFAAVPQGPAIRRSGTQFMAYAYSQGSTQNDRSRLLPFVFSEEQALDIEVAPGRFRFILPNGLQTYAPQAATMSDTQHVLNVPGHTMQPGDQVILRGFDPQYNLEGLQTGVTAVSPGRITIAQNTDIMPTGAPGTVSRVYHVNHVYNTFDKIKKIKALQSADVVFLFCEGMRPYKLSRYGDYDWRFEEHVLDGGPWMPTTKGMGYITIAGNGVPPISGYVGNSSPGNDMAFAFDGNLATSWEGAGTQQGTVGFEMAAPRVLTGYTFYPQQTSPETDYSPLERAPGTWTLQGRDGAGVWHTLDQQNDFQAYELGRTPIISVENTTAYYAYQWVVTACKRNGNMKPRLAHIGLRFAPGTASNDVIMVLQGATNVNKGQGFLPTDNGRLIRVRDTLDGFYRYGRINGVNPDTRTISVHILSDTFVQAGNQYFVFQLGYYSDTTGWPFVGEFFEDRLWLGGSTQFPDLISASRTGTIDDFETSTPQGEVLDDSALAFRTNTPRLSGIRWMDSDERGLLIGDGSREHVITAASTDGAVTARNIRRRSSTQRGSSRYVDQIKVDRQILFVQNGGRNLRELAYQYEADGYKAPSMTLFASHLASQQLEEAAYAQEPYSIIWYRTALNNLIGFTYNREENVIGWHSHDFNGEVETISVTPSLIMKQDVLTMIVKRTLPGGGVIRSIERLMRFWDFQDTVQSAHFVDCALRYEGAPTTKVYGLLHLNGATVEGLADGVPFQGTVVNGSLTLTEPASNILVGLPYVSEGETARIEAGAADGTAQGKEKRMNALVVSLWQSAYGEIGRYNEDQGEVEYLDVEYKEPYDELQPITLQDGMFGPFTPPAGYGKLGSIYFRQTKPLPFNLIGLFPQINTQDR